MSVGEEFITVLCSFRTEDISRREPSLPVWDVGRPGLFAWRRRERQQAVDRCRAQLLSALLAAEGPTFVVHGEEPQPWEVPGPWECVGPSTWLLPADFDPQEPAARSWLFVVGNGRLYKAAQAALAPLPDSFVCKASELLDWMRQQSIDAWIDSFHDGAAWVVAARPAAELDLL